MVEVEEIVGPRDPRCHLGRMTGFGVGYPWVPPQSLLGTAVAGCPGYS